MKLDAVMSHRAEIARRRGRRWHEHEHARCGRGGSSPLMRICKLLIGNCKSTGEIRRLAAEHNLNLLKHTAGRSVTATHLGYMRDVYHHDMKKGYAYLYARSQHNTVASIPQSHSVFRESSPNY